MAVSGWTHLGQGTWSNPGPGLFGMTCRLPRLSHCSASQGWRTHQTPTLSTQHPETLLQRGGHGRPQGFPTAGPGLGWVAAGLAEPSWPGPWLEPEVRSGPGAVPRAPALTWLLTSRKGSQEAQEGRVRPGWTAPHRGRGNFSTPQSHAAQARGPARAGLSADYSFVSALGA